MPVNVEKPLRLISPKLYQFVVKHFEAYNIHSFDLMIYGTKRDDGMEISIYFGERFTQKKTAFFLMDSIKNQGEELIAFLNSVSETCKQVMIDEYFERMAP